MFGATGAGMSKFKNMQNGGKRQRRSLDQWDRVRRHQYIHTTILKDANLFHSKVRQLRLQRVPFSWKTQWLTITFC